MTNRNFNDRWWQTFRLLYRTITAMVLVCAGLLLYLMLGDSLRSWWEPPLVMPTAQGSPVAVAAEKDQIENGIHVATGLVYAEGFELVRATCTACHSAKLVTQNRASRQGWRDMIRWMQATQGLWDLGPSEGPILDYLAKHYAPEEVGRRPQLDLTEVEWYILDLDE